MSNPVRRYTGEAIEVTYDVKRCIHAAECVRGLPAVFDTTRRPWILPDAAPAEQVAEIVARCPSGALHAFRPDGSLTELPPPENIVQVQPNGPLYVRGQLRVQRADGSLLLEDTRIALCRCGQSQNKPFCDNSHRAAGFTDPGAVVAAGEPPTTSAPLTITAIANGPLMLEGSGTLVGQQGEASYAMRVKLCRCGGSGTKPLCDGTHRRIGFRDQEAQDDKQP